MGSKGKAPGVYGGCMHPPWRNIPLNSTRIYPARPSAFPSTKLSFPGNDHFPRKHPISSNTLPHSRGGKCLLLFLCFQPCFSLWFLMAAAQHFGVHFPVTERKKCFIVLIKKKKVCVEMHCVSEAALVLRAMVQ